MALNKKPVNGMKDILPEEMQIRDYVMGVIKENYRKFGFTPIETPCVESIGNLCSKQGGENEKLIFKILKRGEKLNLETAKEENDLVDSGLRYDLTLPLSRYYANHANELPNPFKALQMGNVWRADRPQKGRFRQFMQCDIDILGEPSNLAEIELILATTTTLGKLGFSNFKVRINERRILKAMAAYSGFPEDQYDLVFIILDKMDKIGLDGVKAELLESGFTQEMVDKYGRLFEGMQAADDAIAYLAGELGDYLEIGYFEQEMPKGNTNSCIQEIWEEFPSYTQYEVRSALAKCGLTTKHIESKVKVLSGGEQAKVRLCKLINRETNLLLLDEPTNHLDVDAKEELKRALSEYKGSVLLVCHEPEFYEGLVDKIWNLEEYSKLIH